MSPKYLAALGSLLLLLANFTLSHERPCPVAFRPVGLFSDSCGYAGLACWFGAFFWWLFG